jgi:hypothetical protein
MRLLRSDGMAGFLSRIVARARREFDLRRYFAGKDLTSVWILHNLLPLKCQLRSRRNDPLRILEIGSWEGASATFFLRFVPRSRIVCIDTFAGSAEHHQKGDYPELSLIERRFDSNSAEFAGRVQKIKSTSRDALSALNASGSQFDVIYIDGSHQYVDVSDDTRLAWPLAAPGCLIVWDDALWPGVMRAIADFLEAHYNEYSIEFCGRFQFMVRKS